MSPLGSDVSGASGTRVMEYFDAGVRLSPVLHECVAHNAQALM